MPSLPFLVASPHVGMAHCPPFLQSSYCDIVVAYSSRKAIAAIEMQDQLGRSHCFGRDDGKGNELSVGSWNINDRHFIFFGLDGRPSMLVGLNNLRAQTLQIIGMHFLVHKRG